MDDLGRRLAGAREHLREPDWDAAHGERQLARLQARLRRRRLARGGAAVAVLAAAAAAVVVLSTRAPEGDASDRALVDGDREVQTVRFSDGSSARALDGRARLTVVEVSERRVLVELATGAAAFDVTPRASREFVVRAGEVTVVVLGTRFQVVRSAARVEVSVQRGRVSVRWDDQQVEVAAGSSTVVPLPGDAEPTEPSAAAEPSSPEAPTPEPGASRPEPSQPGEPADDWRELAEAGDFDAAFVALSSRRAQVAEDPDELMLAADAARLSGHPADALVYLRRVVDDHPDDPRAPLAAFTLGRVLLAEVGRPADAARAFAQARALDPSSALAQDALAREVEAWYRGGEQERATRLGQEYLTLYPEGVHAAAVRRYAGLP